MRNPLANNTTRSPIGLDVGSKTIKAAQVRAPGVAVQLAAATEFARTGTGVYPDAEEIARIERVLFRQGFTGHAVVLGVPRSAAMFEEIERPPKADGVPVDQIVAAEIARVRKLDPSSIEQAWWEMPSSGRRSSGGTAMALATERSPLVEVVERFEEVGIEVVGAEPVLTALCTAVAARGLGAEPFTVIADVGWASTTLGVMYQGVLVYQRECESCGLSGVVARASTTGRMDPGSAEMLVRDATLRGVSGHASVRRAIDELAGTLVTEIQASLGYASHRYRKDAAGAVLLCGGGASLSVVVDRVNTIGGIETTPLVADRLVTNASDAVSTAPGPTLAAACALAGLDGGGAG